jgi:hypothetical protein
VYDCISFYNHGRERLIEEQMLFHTLYMRHNGCQECHKLPHFGGFDFENHVCLYFFCSNFPEEVARRRRGRWVKFCPVFVCFRNSVWFCSFFPTSRWQRGISKLCDVGFRVFCILAGLDCPCLVDLEVNMYVLRPAGRKFKFLNYNALWVWDIIIVCNIIVWVLPLCYY